MVDRSETNLKRIGKKKKISEELTFNGIYSSLLVRTGNPNNRRRPLDQFYSTLICLKPAVER